MKRQKIKKSYKTDIQTDRQTARENERETEGEREREKRGLIYTVIFIPLLHCVSYKQSLYPHTLPSMTCADWPDEWEIKL